MYVFSVYNYFGVFVENATLKSKLEMEIWSEI